MSGDYDARMAALRSRFAARLEDERAFFGCNAPATGEGGLADRAHKLAGIAGSFGYAEIGELARQVEDACLADAGEVRPALDRLLAALDTALAQ